MEGIIVYGTRYEIMRIQEAYGHMSPEMQGAYRRLPLQDRTAEVAWNLVKLEERTVRDTGNFQCIGDILCAQGLTEEGLANLVKSRMGSPK
jgi:hypothetical protein